MVSLRMLGLLMLFLLHGADSDSCSSELNPLILEPIIGEYGSRVMVNCNSTRWDHDGITLLVGNHSITNEPGINYANYSVELTDWNMTGECKIQLNDSIECIKEVEITAYKNPEVDLYIERINEKQNKLVCDVTNFAPAQNLTVTWYRDDEIMATNLSAKLTKEPVNESFALAFNINRAEKVVQIRCQAQLDLGPYTPLDPVISQTYNVSALYAPEVNTSDSHNISVSMGENVTLTCDVEGNPTPDFQWTVDGKNMTENTSQLNLTEVNDSAIYTCIATNDLGNKSVEIHLHVTEVITRAAPVTMTPLDTQAPQGFPLILTPPEIMVKFGDPVEVNCSSNTEINGIGWEASVGGLPAQKNVSAVTWKVEKLEVWGIKPSCFANLKNGPQLEIVANITLYQIPDVSISAVDQGPMIQGEEYRMMCDIYNVAPVQLKVKWYHGNKTVFTDNIQNNKTTPTNVSSHYIVTPQRGDNGTVYRCEAELQLGPKGPKFLSPVTSDPLTAVVHYKPVFKASPWHHIVAEGNFTMNELPLEIDANPPTTVKWYYQGKPIDPRKSLLRADSGNYIGEAENTIGKTDISVLITVEYKPNITCEEQYEVVVTSEVKNPCELQGLPSPSITWFKHEKTFSPPRWTKHDSGMYSLKATNTHGEVETKFNLTVLYAPEFVDGNTTIEITLGQNVTFNCSAKGNPTPEIEWTNRSTNLIKTTGGRYSIITIMEATSVNAGVYQCVATNKVGTVTRFVKLLEKDKTTDSPHPGWILPVVLSVGFLGLLVLFVLLRNNRKKQGQYSFVENKDASLIAMTTQTAEGST